MEPAPIERPRLLIVEDEPVLCVSLAEFFADEGFVVACANSIAVARDHLAGAHFCAAILDVGLPDGDGLSLVPELGAGRAVVVSATPDEARYGACGVVHHVAKPVDLRALTRLVRAAAGIGSPCEPAAGRQIASAATGCGATCGTAAARGRDTAMQSW
jgi:DNA-binding response OmpR family regulator